MCVYMYVFVELSCKEKLDDLLKKEKRRRRVEVLLVGCGNKII